jgi:flagellar protein FlgJ
MTDVDVQEWTRQELGAAKAVAGKIGCDPAVLVAIAALESGWGRHVPRNPNTGESSRNNWWIKAEKERHGPTVTVPTFEYTNGQHTKILSQFMAYSDNASAWEDFGEFFLKNPRYDAAVESAVDPERFVSALSAAGYSTEPNYARRVLQVYDQILAQISREQPS